MWGKSNTPVSLILLIKNASHSWIILYLSRFHFVEKLWWQYFCAQNHFGWLEKWTKQTQTNVGALNQGLGINKISFCLIDIVTVGPRGILNETYIKCTKIKGISRCIVVDLPIYQYIPIKRTLIHLMMLCKLALFQQFEWSRQILVCKKKHIHLQRNWPRWATSVQKLLFLWQSEFWSWFLFNFVTVNFFLN